MIRQQPAHRDQQVDLELRQIAPAAGPVVNENIRILVIHRVEALQSQPQHQKAGPLQLWPFRPGGQCNSQELEVRAAEKPKR